MSVHSRPDDRNEVRIVGMSGDLDLSSVAQLRSAAHRLIEDGWVRMVIDLEEVAFLDSAGIGVLIGIRRRCVAAGGDAVLARPSDDVERMLKAAEVDRIFDVFGVLDDSITHVRLEGD